MKDHREAFIAYVMDMARKWRPTCKMCFFETIDSCRFDQQWVRSKDCTCLGLHGLTPDQLHAFQNIFLQLLCHSGKQREIQYDLECQIRDFQRAVDASYTRDILFVEIYNYQDFHVDENKQCIITVWNSHEKKCSCCNMLVPICAAWLNLRRNALSLCLKRLGICKDMRIYIAKMINCGNSVSL